jgi:Protein of unknown function (DUF642)
MPVEETRRAARGRIVMRAFGHCGVVGAALAASTLIVSCGTTSAATNLIKNGSFEKPVVPAGGFKEFSKGQAFAGWRVVGATGNVAVVSGKYQADGITFNANAGAQWLDLTGYGSNTATGVAQRVATTSGTRYHLTFWVGNVYDPGGVFGVSSMVKVYVNGVRGLAATNSLHPANHRQAWKEFALTFKATSRHTTITFINGDPRNDNSNGIDAVHLR